MILNSDETLYNNIKINWDRKIIFFCKTKANILIASLPNMGKELNSFNEEY